MEISERLREAREAKGWSQSQLANRLGISQQMYHPYEHGRELKSGMIIKLCAVLECSPNWLLGVKETGMQLAPDSLLLKQLKQAFEKLNVDGQHEAVRHVEQLTEIKRFQKGDGQASGQSA